MAKQSAEKAAFRFGPAARWLAPIGFVLCAALPSTLGDGVATAQGPDPGSESPNVVVIMTDDQTMGAVQHMPQVQSRIAQEGVRFTQSFVNLPLCCPSRTTFLTGQYAHNHGVLDNNPPDGGFEAFEPAFGTNNLPLWLQAAGYHTAMVGKYLNGYGDADPQYLPAGWSEWYVAVGDVQAAYGYSLNENGTLVGYGNTEQDYKQDVFTRHAVSIVEQEAPSDQPLFLWVSYTAPHSGGPNPNPLPPADCALAPKPAPRHATAFDAEPLPQPLNFNEADVSDKPPSIAALPSLTQAEIDALTRRFRCRLESLLSVDEGVGQILDAIEAEGELEDTLVIFTSDNGFFQGEHRLEGGKTRHYDAASRMPLLIAGPDVISGATVDDPVLNADLAPTITAATGAVPGVEPDGLSLLPLAGGAISGYQRDLVVEAKRYSALRTDRFVYVEHTDGEDAGFVELYDLIADPSQLENLADDPAYADVRTELSERLAVMQSCSGPSCHPGFPPPPDPQPSPDPSQPQGPESPGTIVETDTLAPRTSITRGPAETITRTRVRFVFRANEPGASFLCRLDRRRWRPCVSPKIYQGLDPGRHSFRVFAIDAAGNRDPRPALRRFVVRLGRSN